MDSSGPNYTTTTQSQVANTLDTEFQTACLSPSSLRYYGLGLENGPYTVNLQFVDGETWKSLGHRISDVYVQSILPDGKVVAVKQLSAESKQGKREFINEVAAISAMQHRNLVKLHGCCLEGEHQLLVYEYLENNTLAQALYGNINSNVQLTWTTCFNICIGTARGLAYLHEESSIQIVHQDTKASNILLDNFQNPKIADFGLAKLFDDTKTHISTRVVGTVGHLAPEYAMQGHLTEKADMFSFGVVSLEVVNGRSNMESSFPQYRVYLLEWAWNLHEQNQLLELIIGWSHIQKEKYSGCCSSPSLHSSFAFHVPIQVSCGGNVDW